ncbi:MAG: DUF1697 domain-containing protein, partial [Chlamydiae bacterium]|nr:DUF1697 domain-containing protein [Chlamydiota bacterium]
EKELCSLAGGEVSVFLRTMEELEDMINKNPFRKIREDVLAKRYVTFLSCEPKSKLKLPFLSPKKDIEVLEIKNQTVFSLGLAFGNGRFGFPNQWIEKEMGVSATTRNWTTIVKMLSNA